MRDCRMPGVSLLSFAKNPMLPVQNGLKMKGGEEKKTDAGQIDVKMRKRIKTNKNGNAEELRTRKERLSVKNQKGRSVRKRPFDGCL